MALWHFPKLTLTGRIGRKLRTIRLPVISPKRTFRGARSAKETKGDSVTTGLITSAYICMHFPARLLFAADMASQEWYDILISSSLYIICFEWKRQMSMYVPLQSGKDISFCISFRDLLSTEISSILFTRSAVSAEVICPSFAVRMPLDTKKICAVIILN